LLSDQNAEPRGRIEEQVIPLYSEDIAVSRRKVERTVRVHVHTVDREQLIDEAVTQERVEIERVAIGRAVDAVPPVREDGDTTVIPVVEEILVVERRLILKEEIRLHRVRTTERHRETVTLREQQAVIERAEAGGGKDEPSLELAPIPKPQALKESENDG
jgi:stress response protein YsnF